MHWIVTKIRPGTPTLFPSEEKGTLQPPSHLTPVLCLEARTWLLGAMSIGYTHGFSGHNLGSGVVDLGAGLVDPGSVRWERSPGFCGVKEGPVWGLSVSTPQIGRHA